MTRSICARIASVLFVILFLNLAFMPVVSAQGFEEDNVGKNAVALAEKSSNENKNSGDQDQAGLDQMGNSSVDSPDIIFVVGVFAIPITAEIAALLGLSGLVAAIVLYSDGNLGFIKDNTYVKINIALVNIFINGVLDQLGLRSANDYQDAYRKGLPTKNHEIIIDTGSISLPLKDGINSSKDLIKDGKLKQRRYYDENGNADYDWDYDHDHGYGLIHKHKWIWNPDGTCERKQVVFNPDGSETVLD